MIEIENEGFNALQEYLASCSVIITSETKEFEHGTGVAVRFDNQDYILTAGHVLDAEPDNEKIRVIGRPDAPIKEVQKNDLAGAVFKGTQGRVTFSAATHISITCRLASRGSEDVAALNVQNAKKDLPHTVFHNLSGQGDAQISAGAAVAIFGFPGELAQQVQHKVTGQRGAVGFPYFTQQTIKEISATPDQLDPSVDFVTDVTYDERACNPKGISGCGVWSIPRLKESKLWSPSKTQLLGIQSGFYPRTKLLKFVRIERVLYLLSAG